MIYTRPPQFIALAHPAHTRVAVGLGRPQIYHYVAYSQGIQRARDGHIFSLYFSVQKGPRQENNGERNGGGSKTSGKSARVSS